MSIRTRLYGALASTAFGYAVTVVVQLASVPLLLGTWGTSLYGEWLLVSTIPGYLAVSDLGLSSAIGNDMAMSTARGDRGAAITAFQSIGLAIAGLGAITLIVAVLLALLLPLGAWLGTKLIVGRDLTVLIALLIAQVWLGQQSGVLQAGLRCEGYYVAGNVSWQLLRLAEFGALAAAAFEGGGPIAAAAAMLLVRVGYIFVTIALLRLWVPWLRLGISAVRRDTIMQLLRPGLMFLAFPLAGALNVQTPLLLAGMLLGPEAVVAFSTARTLTRSLQQLSNVCGHTVWAEVSHAFGAQNTFVVSRLYRMAVAATVWLSVTGASALALVGPFLYRIWTHRIITLDPALLDVLLLAALAHAIWLSASVVLTATNRHSGLATRYFVINLVLVPLTWLAAELDGLRGVAIALAVCEIAVVTYVLPASLRLVGDHWSDLARSLIRPVEFIQVIRRIG